MSSEIAIRVQNLSKCYQIYNAPRDRLKQFVVPRLQRMAGQTPRQYFREFWALKDISFEVKKGETVGIIGRNGSGKSTLLQMICGTLSPTGGNVETNGRIAALLELGSGFNPEFTGRENVYMNAAVLGLSKEEVDERFDDIAAFADIGEFIEQPVKNYSSGMVVRLAFAVQAMIDPDIFVVDEALAVGDEKFQRKCFARLEKLKSGGSSILFVSHSAGHITELCDKTLFLDHGERLMYSTAPETMRAYRKLIYAPAEEQKRLTQEYRAADQSGVVIESETESMPITASDEPLVAENNTKGQTITTSDAFLSDAFDPGFVSQVIEQFPVQGAEIDSIQIVNDKGKVVNMLRPGMTYQFVQAGRIIDDSKEVHFGIYIRTTTGVCITGQRYPEARVSIDNIAAGKAYKISFSFRIDLLPGVYFVGGGVWSNQEPKHRLLDAFMFRVLEKEKQQSFGYVDSSAGEAKLEII